MTRFALVLAVGLLVALGAPRGVEAQEGAFDWQALGAETYGRCSGCHQATGEGLPGTFPPLAGHLPTLAQAEGGRDYLARVLLYGLQGEITVAGATYNGVMPGWAGSLSDEQVAAVLNHELTSWDNAALLGDDFEPFTPDEISAARELGLAATDVYELRGALELPNE